VGVKVGELPCDWGSVRIMQCENNNLVKLRLLTQRLLMHR
jgi:hypothetical protein